MRRVRRRHEEPRQQGVVDETDGVPAAPRLEERHRDDVVRVGDRRGRNEADRVPPEPRGMPVEDPAEGLPVAREAQCPVGPVPRDLVHVRWCPQTADGFPVRRVGPSPGRRVSPCRRSRAAP
ncbi:hypothetical protein Cus16_2529 [Curtobacterium sp. ER1/6]|nr:hypothetical protein Cus16_2529 [Curtobacterium sp. ER1/6]